MRVSSVPGTHSSAVCRCARVHPRWSGVLQKHEALIALPGISVNSCKLTKVYFTYIPCPKLAEQWLTGTGALGRPARPVVLTGFTRLWAADRCLVDHRDIDPRLWTIQTIDLPEMLEKGPGGGTGNRSTPDADLLPRNRSRENVRLSACLPFHACASEGS